MHRKIAGIIVVGRARSRDVAGSDRRRRHVSGSASPGERSGDARAGELRGRDRPSLLAHGDGDQVGLSGERHEGERAEGQGDRHRSHEEILGIAATVVHDKVTEHGELIENTFDWYAQDLCGNVWYMGENTKEYEDGEVVTTAGSWEAGWTARSRASSCPPIHRSA